MNVEIECDADWEEMEGDDPRRRKCLQCNKTVHNLSAMSRREADELMRRTGGLICVRYASVDGRVRYADDPDLQLRSQRRGSRALVLAAMAAPLLILGHCAGIDRYGPEKSRLLQDAVRDGIFGEQYEVDYTQGANTDVEPMMEF